MRGIQIEKDVPQSTDADWEKIMNTNARGIFLTSRAFIPLMIKNGGGAIAEDLANRTLRGISNGFESSPTLLSNKVSKKLETPNNFSGMVSSTEPLPRFAGMKRLG